MGNQIHQAFAEVINGHNTSQLLLFIVVRRESLIHDAIAQVPRRGEETDDNHPFHIVAHLPSLLKHHSWFLQTRATSRSLSEWLLREKRQLTRCTTLLDSF